MIKLYLETDEFTLSDMLLNASEFANLNFVCGDIMHDAMEGLNDNKVEMGHNYGFSVHHGLGFFTNVKHRVYEIFKTNKNSTICIDNLCNWLLGINSKANTIEYMYSEQQVDELREFITVLVNESNKHDISILCNEYMLQYIIDTIHMNNYVIID